MKIQNLALILVYFISSNVARKSHSKRFSKKTNKMTLKD